MTNPFLNLIEVRDKFINTCMQLYHVTKENAEKIYNDYIYALDWASESDNCECGECDDCIEYDEETEQKNDVGDIKNAN